MAATDRNATVPALRHCALKLAGLNPKTDVKDLRGKARKYAYKLYVDVVLSAQACCNLPSDDSGHGVRAVSALFEVSERTT